MVVDCLVGGGEWFRIGCVGGGYMEQVGSCAWVSWGGGGGVVGGVEDVERGVEW